jgi:CheY-like chemotaxis protein
MTIAQINRSKKLIENKEVLLIGVDEVDQMLLRYMVEEQGAALKIENRTDEAIELIKDRRYDLLMINMRLERLNTLHLVSEMRANREIRVPVIGLSSNDMNGRALNSGFDAVITRPIEKRKLLKALSHLY